jgi:chromosomal replication initiator protein
MNAPCLFLQRLGVTDLVTDPPRHTMRDIATMTAERYGLTVDDLKSPSQERRIAWPRQEAMVLIRQHTRQSYPQIGRFFGDRDHTTVIHAVRQVERRRLAAMQNGEAA